MAVFLSESEQMFRNYFSIPAKVDVPEMEPVSRDETALEGQDPVEQRDLAVLAHTVHQR